MFILKILLKLSYAIEVGAYNAYSGHIKSLEGDSRQHDIIKIQADEMHHQGILEDMLTELQSKPSPALNFIFKIVGGCLGALCFIIGKRLPIIGAGLIEVIGIINYDVIAEFSKNVKPEFINDLKNMAHQERKHKEVLFTSI